MRKRARPVHFSGALALDWMPIFFITVCTARRKPILAFDDITQLLIASWKRAHYWSVGRYVIMPDHLHLFCSPSPHCNCSLDRWVRFWKFDTSRCWPRIGEYPYWQPDFG